MTRTVIIYKSKYGATARYAALLSEMLGGEALEAGAAGAGALEGADTVIFAGMDRFRRLLPALTGRRLALLCVGALPYDEKALAALRTRCSGLPEDVPLFYARGAWDESRMGLKDRAMCRLLQKMVAKQPPEQCEPWMRELLSAMGQKRDWVSADYLAPLLAYVNADG